MSNENTSGLGSSYSVPEEVAKKFNWGAFFWGCLWGLFNKSYITLLIIITCFIHGFLGSIISLCFQIWFGIMGNKWAWQNKKFDSIDSFHAYQKKWAIAGVIICVIGIIGVILTIALPYLMTPLK